MHLNVVLLEQFQFSCQIVFSRRGSFGVFPNAERFVRHHDADVQVPHTRGRRRNGVRLRFFRGLDGCGGGSGDSTGADTKTVAPGTGGVLAAARSDL